MKHVNKIPNLVTAKEMRDGIRYKQKEIAIASGLSEPIISRLMRSDDIGAITYASAKALAKWLGVSMEELGEEVEE